MPPKTTELHHDWILQLPEELQEEIANVIKTNPQTINVFSKVHEYIISKDFESNKKRKLNYDDNKPEKIAFLESVIQQGTSPAPEPPHMPKPEPVSTNAHGDKTNLKVDLDEEIHESQKIFEIPSISFQSPIRKKFDLVFHVLEQGKLLIPTLSIVNLNTKKPEYSITNLKESVKLCFFLPILGNTTIASKKKIVSLCFFLDDKAALNPGKSEPIVCQINFDLMQKILLEREKMHKPNVDEDDEPEDERTKPIEEAAMGFLIRQFKLCGINLTNYLPTSELRHNQLNVNSDLGIAVSSKANSINDLVIVEAYKGSRDGSLCFIASNKFSPACLIFGFRKPTLLFEISKIKHISYHNITRLTFSILVTIFDETKPKGEEIFEFGMIDQNHYQLIDDFIKKQKVNDNSFNDQLREKTKSNENGVAREEGEANDGEDDSAHANLATLQEPADSDDEEEDGTYTGGVEGEEEDADDSENDEEFTGSDDDGDVSGSGSGSGSEGDEEGEEEEATGVKEEEEDEA